MSAQKLREALQSVWLLTFTIRVEDDWAPIERQGWSPPGLSRKEVTEFLDKKIADFRSEYAAQRPYRIEAQANGTGETPVTKRWEAERETSAEQMRRYVESYVESLETKDTLFEDPLPESDSRT